VYQHPGLRTVSLEGAGLKAACFTLSLISPISFSVRESFTIILCGKIISFYDPAENCNDILQDECTHILQGRCANVLRLNAEVTEERRAIRLKRDGCAYFVLQGRLFQDLRIVFLACTGKAINFENKMD
jgi:hypothetical protein